MSFKEGSFGGSCDWSVWYWVFSALPDDWRWSLASMWLGPTNLTEHALQSQLFFCFWGRRKRKWYIFCIFRCFGCVHQVSLQLRSQVWCFSSCFCCFLYVPFTGAFGFSSCSFEHTSYSALDFHFGTIFWGVWVTCWSLALMFELLGSGTLIGAPSLSTSLLWHLALNHVRRVWFFLFDWPKSFLQDLPTHYVDIWFTPHSIGIIPRSYTRKRVLCACGFPKASTWSFYALMHQSKVLILYRSLQRASTVICG